MPEKAVPSPERYGEGEGGERPKIKDAPVRARQRCDEGENACRREKKREHARSTKGTRTRQQAPGESRAKRRHGKQRQCCWQETQRRHPCAGNGGQRTTVHARHESGVARAGAEGENRTGGYSA